MVLNRIEAGTFRISKSAPSSSLIKFFRVTALLCPLLLIAAFPLSALDVPPLTERVVDNANLLNASETEALTSLLESLEEATGAQIAVLTVATLAGDSLESFGIRVADTWKLGQKDEDNGAILIVALAERKIRIEVGYGLEDKLTDMKCGLIIRNVIAPHFQNGDYGEGITAGVKNMVGIVADDADLVSKRVTNEAVPTDVIPIVAFIVFFLINVLFAMISARYNRRYPSSRIYRSAFGNDFFSSSSGGGFSSGGSSGGFSGGGGGFGGGGASGGW
ncbi:PF04536 family protein [Treponema socranskii subsp. socranskii VPI DR56BR1116 = ATCC 35536]|uniref:PF04536 family protein n=1 Tax=Treponema socranskii subsp. socranskii VPI DR56BR1116 = ATCC 35536 TaxID=1125725 RepID=U1FQJ9_TRESO|nr:TPM domain-containing protein [Treponema socranskii]ERF61771.1 PF04536 family protein [Treponema socranskii subsp. socranskii VPI DR56BR1116 = ATCC 35536]ERK05162.1 PF04536 family protein [Treponema socranskii subsp. socranskii VPI DR56BR1116 = ATCC 35536]